METASKTKTDTFFTHSYIRYVFVAVLILFALLTYPKLVKAQANSTINFQSKIVNLSNGTNLSAGSPACISAGSDTCDFRVSIYTESSGGTLLWQETHSDVELGDNNGIFNLSLNSVCNSWTSPSGGCSGSGITWGSDSTVYLQVEFDPSGNGDFSEGETFDRKLISSVPFSYYSDTAGNVSTNFTEGSVTFIDSNGQLAQDNSNFYWNNTTKQLGIGTNTLNARLDIAAATTGTAQINLTTSGGVDPSSPVSGDLWWNGTALNFYDGSSTVDLLSGGSSLWTDGGAITYLTATGDNVALGGSSSSSPFYFDVAANNLRIGDGVNDTNNPTITFYASDGSSSAFLSVLDGGEFFAFSQAFSPLTNDTYNLGTNTQRWSTAYLNQGTGLSLGVDGNNAEIWYNNSFNYIAIDPDGDSTSNFFMMDTGRLGIGEVGPDQLLHITGGSNDAAVTFSLDGSGTGDQGPNSPSSATTIDDSDATTSAWSNPSNVYSSDNSRASNTTSLSSIVATTEYIRITGFNFDSIPAGSTITGIEVDVEKHFTASGVGDVYDEAVRIVKNNNISTTDRSNVNTWPNGSGNEAYTTYGSSSDLWGETWNITDIESANFGVAIRAEWVDNPVDGGSDTASVYIDHVRITVHYTTAPVDWTLGFDQSSAASSTLTRLKIAGSSALGTSDYFGINADGEVGIGTTSPGKYLAASSSESTVASFTSTDSTGQISFVDSTTTNDTSVTARSVGNELSLFSDGVLRLRVDDAGLVGINNSNPAYALDVTGQIYVKNGTSSQIIQSDGTSTWYRLAGNDCVNATTAACWSRNGTTSGDMKMRLNPGGALILASTFTPSGSPDIAENVKVEPGVSTADIVVANISDDSNIDIYDRALLSKSSSEYDKRIVGVISSDPGILLNSSEISTGNPQEGREAPLAIAGRVPVKISNSSAPINPGDPITSSSDPGRGMKATKSGTIVGIALESWNYDSDTILVFINPGYYQLDSLENLATEPAPLVDPDSSVSVHNISKDSGEALFSLTIGTDNYESLRLNVSELIIPGSLRVEGDITSTGVINALAINSDSISTSKLHLGGSAGNFTIPAGQSQVTVNNPNVTTNSFIKIIPNTFSDYKLIEKITGVGFVVQTSNTEVASNFDYIIVN